MYYGFFFFLNLWPGRVSCYWVLVYGGVQLSRVILNPLFSLYSETLLVIGDPDVGLPRLVCKNRG